MIYSKYPLKVLQEVEPFPPIQNTDNPYLTEAAMYADQGNQLQGYIYVVTVVGHFEYLGTIVGDDTDYRFVGKKTVDFITEVTGTPTTISGYGITDAETSSQIEISRSNISYGESYIANYRNSVLDDGATFFPSDAGYEVGKLKESGVMNDCSLLLLPSAVKAVTLYSVKPQDRSGDFTVDRNSTATYIDEDGLIKTALANVPRINYGTGEAALLIEPQSTNLITYSEDFSDASWNGGTNCQVDANFAISPDGTLNADKLTSTTNINSRKDKTVSVTSQTNKVFSLWIKKGAINVLSKCRVAIQGDVEYILPHLDITNEWVKYSLAVPDTDISTSIIVRVYPSSRNDGSLGDEILVWGAQIEVGTEASSYIPTNGATVTRLADNISVPTPAGVTSITETIDGVEQTPITTIPTTYSLPVGNINKVTMQ